MLGLPPTQGQKATCRNCHTLIQFDTFLSIAGPVEKYDPYFDSVTWRHATNGRARKGHVFCDTAVGQRADPAEEYVYVASSWRNQFHPEVVAELRKLGIPHYDFKHPTGEESDGFHWSEVMPNYQRPVSGQAEQLAEVSEYIQALQTEEADAGFHRDWDAMNRASTFILVLPCNRSAHLELGWAVGAGRRTAILLDGPFVTPELMYKMVDLITPDMDSLMRWVRYE